MYCRAFEARLQVILDERQRPEFDDALQQHAAECKACSDLLRGQQLLLDGIDLTSVPSMEISMSHRFTPELVGLADSSLPSIDSPSRSRPWLAAAMAAGILLALYLVLPSPRDREMTEQGAPIAMKLFPESEIRTEWGLSNNDLSTRSEEITSPLSQLLVEKMENPGISNSLLLVSPPAHLAGLSFSHAPLRRQVGNWMRNQADNNLPVEKLREDLRPFSSRLANMLEALWQSLGNPLGQDMG
jgi:hypothetical protein